jgi:multiple sugar transport system ATP-binding protein
MLALPQRQHATPILTFPLQGGRNCDPTIDNMAFLRLQNLEKSFGAHRAIKSVSLTLEKGEFVVFVGPSGCGKSTLLRLIAGLETPDSGSVHLDGRDITQLPSSQRDLAMVFQSYALYPHMNVYQNMSFALKLAKQDPARIKQKVERAAKILNLEPYLQRMPRELSGGQRQRVAIGRAIVRAPKVFLFDEPLSNLDAALRGQTRVEIAKLHRELGATTIYVTHDQVEAMTLADRVVVLREGIIEQAGSPLELYDRPANQFVAQFIGTPQMNLLSAAEAPQLNALLRRSAPPDGCIGLRPEALRLVAAGNGHIQAKVELVEALGAETLVYVSTERGTSIAVRQSARSALHAGEQTGIEVDLAAVHVFDAGGKVLEP